MGKPQTGIQFIKKGVKKYGDHYDYSLVIYKNSKTKVKIRCKKHNLIFEQTPNTHLTGKGGCIECKRDSVRYTKEEAINMSVEVHGDKYDYSKVIFKNMSDKVKIICKRHNIIFELCFTKHIRGSGKGKGRGCPKCAREHFNYNQLTTETFKEKSIEVHGHKYGYDAVDYVRGIIKVKIYCKRHEKFFEQLPSSHLMGNGCPDCGKENGLITKKLNNKFFEKAVGLNGERYDYSEVVYINSVTKVKIRCIKHDYYFYQTPQIHLRGGECPKCFKESRKLRTSSNTEDFIKKSEAFHGTEKHDYSLVDYKSSEIKVKIICKKHNEIFEISPSNHLRGGGCKKCRNSKGEQKISNFLDKHNIIYKREQSFEGCKSRGLLHFDFYIPDFNLCIEFDGAQHFTAYERFGGEFALSRQKEKDEIKNNYCLKNGIKLIRIPYTKKDREIEAILKEAFQIL